MRSIDQHSGRPYCPLTVHYGKEPGRLDGTEKTIENAVEYSLR